MPVGTAFAFPLSTIGHAKPEQEINSCIRHIAELERAVSRQTTGDTKRRIIALTSQACRSFGGRLTTLNQNASIASTISISCGMPTGLTT